MRIAATVTLLTFAVALPAVAEEQPTYKSLWDSVSRNADCKPADRTDLIIYTCGKDFTLWYFTKAGHPAHPGVVRRSVIGNAKGANISEQGWSFASDAAQPAFKTFLAQIRALDEQMKETIAQEHGGTPAAGLPVHVYGNWQPQDGDNQAVLSLTTRYFALEDSGQYQDAYALLDSSLTAQLSLAQYISDTDRARKTVGRVKSRTIKTIDWEKDSPFNPPGTFAALDYAAEAEKGQLCGFVSWRRAPDGFFTLMREETNIILATVHAEDASKLKANLHCVP